MKKVLSVFLAALMLFSCFGVMTYAEDGGEIKDPAIITFKYLVNTYDENGEPNGVTEIAKEFQIENNSVLTSDQMNTFLKEMSKQVSYKYTVEEYGASRQETVTYTFDYFTIEGHDEGERYNFEGTGETRIADGAVFVANYVEKDTGDNVTFWEFVQSVFARINLIFEYFAAIFGF